jgi:hypothetical protein
LPAYVLPGCCLLLAAVTLTGLIWTRYSTQINPINYNLMTVNAFMAVTGIYQLSRKIRCALAFCACGEARNNCLALATLLC